MLKLQYSGHLMQIPDSLEKTLMLGKVEGRKRRGWQDEMVGWHHQFNVHELGQILGDGEEQGGSPCSPRGCKELDTTWRLNNHTNQPLSFSGLTFPTSSLGVPGIISLVNSLHPRPCLRVCFGMNPNCDSQLPLAGKWWSQSENLCDSVPQAMLSFWSFLGFFL